MMLCWKKELTCHHTDNRSFKDIFGNKLLIIWRRYMYTDWWDFDWKISFRPTCRDFWSLVGRTIYQEWKVYNTDNFLEEDDIPHISVGRIDRNASLEEFREYVNSVELRIQFTFEIEKDRVFNFADLSIKQVDNKFFRKVYQK